MMVDGEPMRKFLLSLAVCLLVLAWGMNWGLCGWLQARGQNWLANKISYPALTQTLAFLAIFVSGAFSKKERKRRGKSE